MAVRRNCLGGTNPEILFQGENEASAASTDRLSVQSGSQAREGETVFALAVGSAGRELPANTVLMASTSLVIPSGFVSTASTPVADFKYCPMFSLYIVNKIMGTSGISFFKTDAASAPFILGIARSSKTKSGLMALAFVTASRPSVASL